MEKKKLFDIPQIGQKIAIVYYEKEWGEQLFNLLKKIYWDIGVVFINDKEVRFKDGTCIWLYGANPYSECHGRRSDIVLFQSEIRAEIRECCIIPMANMGKQLALCWHNNKWFRAEELFPNPRNAVKEAEEWLASLENI